MRNNNRNTEVYKMELPDNYVEEAEKVILKIPGKSKVSTTKLRKLLSLLTEVYNRENFSDDEKLSENSKSQLQLIIMRMYYESSRDQNLKEFIEDCHLLNYLKDVEDSRKKLIHLTHYLESLVAFFKYYDKGSE